MMIIPAHSSLTIDRTKITLYRYVFLIVALTTITFSIVAEASANDDADNDVDPGSDFNGYMKEMDRREQQEHAYESKLAAHEEWRQTTWSGFFVRQVQKVLNHLKPFIVLVLDAIKNNTNNNNNNGNGGGEGSTITNFIMYIGVRMSVIIIFCIFGYMGGKVFQLIIGTNNNNNTNQNDNNNNIIEVVEEIVILHEYDTEEEAAKGRAITSRGKKQKQKKIQ